ncbi:hypothetical protein FS837_009205 [Tulasnella sp. UAMH 9824]|nr:hypothetical protein FS837_009205 [Tulasnella sp. UAMH 9824]
MNQPQFEPRLTAIPEIPQVFGQDGGHFYRHYDALADELDEDMIKTLKSQLDSIIIFLVAGGNGTIRSANDLPSATFTPSPGIVPVNVLFSLSLTLAILISFFAILGQQWLVYYLQRNGGGIENQRWDQLQRYLGAKRWGLEAVLHDTLPALLQLDLLIFCIALLIYLRTLSKTACYVVATPIIIAVQIVLRLYLVSGLPTQLRISEVPLISTLALHDLRGPYDSRSGYVVP